MHKQKISIHVTLSVCLLSCLLSCSSNKKTGIEIELKFYDNLDVLRTPVTFNLPSDFTSDNIIYEVTSHDGTQNISGYAQVWHSELTGKRADDQNRKVSFLPESQQLKSGTWNRVHFLPSSQTPPEVFRFERSEDTYLHLFESDEPVFTYNYGMLLKPGVPEDRRRSGYIFPLYGPDGTQILDDFPEDHYHHRGLYWAWPHVVIDGESYDLWHIKGIYQRFEKWLGEETGPVFSRFGVQNGWYLNDKKVMDEIAWVTIFRSGDIGRVLDFRLSWETVDKDITLIGKYGDKKTYGGFNVRFAPFQNPKITTNEGHRNKNSDTLRFPWADLSALFDDNDKYSGLSVFENSNNINFPNAWTLRHYGFLNPAWPGMKPFTLKPGKPVNAEYRVWVHRGDAAEGKTATAYALYANPPELRIIE